MKTSPDFIRSGPVHFQSLERELSPISGYVSGRFLNAGCGNRDLLSWLAQLGVKEIVNYDIASDIPGAVIGSLDQLPFRDESFDTILCNAVLEHVSHPQRVVGELARVLKQGGHAVLTVPFLQPYHECPHDFTRYTVEGLTALGQGAGLRVVVVNPVHSTAQTIGWILWEIAKEKGQMMRAILWPFLFAWSRLSHQTDHRIRRNANAFQIVFVK